MTEPERETYEARIAAIAHDQPEARIASIRAGQPGNPTSAGTGTRTWHYDERGRLLDVTTDPDPAE